MRLDKMLSHLGYGSRKEVKTILKKHELLVNGQRVKDGKVSIETAQDQVFLDGEPLVYEAFVYYMLHKPKGVISATEDIRDRTVIDLIVPEDYRQGLFPVGRLDKDTTGLLLLTNDGALAHDLLSPKKKVPKRYLALVDGIVTAEDQALFAEGFKIDGEEWVKPSLLEILAIDEVNNRSEIALTIVEGKFHQVKRMMKTVGKTVLELHRESMGGLTLDMELKRGDYRKLTAVEVEILQGKAK
ncbi:pseudouridine synthase [Vagococcus zengguangii]|uniref:pseudouridine synthase n=1 Tax=Vagococcus zengguangii TaxID=2571750 RepID=UPI0024822756|nr:pseudouridine synthase [Vagococcus zengguangii]